MNISYKLLPKICRMKESDFTEYADKLDDTLYFRDNRANILAVAHLDYVIQDKFCTMVNNKYALSPQLDDRLGVHIILNILPEININVDVLLTTNEESCQSTAMYFEAYKKYNWIVEFDRAGYDTVTYQYGNKKLHKALTNYGLYIGHGTYTDIRELEHLNCKAFNIGIGYQNAHMINCYADLRITSSNIVKFKEFYDRYKDVKMPHKKSSKFYSFDTGSSNIFTDEYYKKYVLPDKTVSITNCEICGNNLLKHELSPIYIASKYKWMSLCDDCYDYKLDHSNTFVKGLDENGEF